MTKRQFVLRALWASCVLVLAIGWMLYLRSLPPPRPQFQVMVNTVAVTNDLSGARYATVAWQTRTLRSNVGSDLCPGKPLRPVANEPRAPEGSNAGNKHDGGATISPTGKKIGTGRVLHAHARATLR